MMKRRKERYKTETFTAKNICAHFTAISPPSLVVVVAAAAAKEKTCLQSSKGTSL